MLTIDAYIGFVTTMMLAFGLILEFPVLLVPGAGGRAELPPPVSRRRWAILAIVLFAIILTPGGDPISPILAVVMFVLFEGTLQIIRAVRP